MKYYGQYKQDQFIDYLFNKKTNGFFVDIGAHDGISFSNTYFFETTREWGGICIEPIPSVFEKLKINRKCHLINCCISDKETSVTFREVTGYPEMLSGILDFFDQKHIERIQTEIKQYGGDYKDIVIDSKDINNILNTYNKTEIDYISIDTEGVEIQIIKSIDFDRFNIKSFTIENNNNDKTVRNLLKEKGYTCIAGLTDDYFFQKKLPRIKRTKMKIFLYKYMYRIKSKLKKQ